MPMSPMRRIMSLAYTLGRSCPLISTRITSGTMNHKRPLIEDVEHVDHAHRGRTR